MADVDDHSTSPSSTTLTVSVFVGMSGLVVWLWLGVVADRAGYWVEILAHNREVEHK